LVIHDLRPHSGNQAFECLADVLEPRARLIGEGSELFPAVRLLLIAAAASSAFEGDLLRGSPER
jgi:hypothetical protein